MPNELEEKIEFGLERRSAPSSCEVCGEVTTLRAQLASFRPLFVLCWEHQSAVSLRVAMARRASRSSEPAERLG